MRTGHKTYQRFTYVMESHSDPRVQQLSNKMYLYTKNMLEWKCNQQHGNNNKNKDIKPIFEGK